METAKSDWPAAPGPVSSNHFLRDLVPATEVYEALGFSRFVVKRYQQVHGFPPLLKLGHRTYFSRSAVDRWISTRSGSTE